MDEMVTRSVVELGVEGEHFLKNWLITQLRCGRVIAKGKNRVVLSGYFPGNIAMNVRVPDLRSIAHVIEVQFHTDPQTYALWYDKWLYNTSARTGGDAMILGEESNVVGLTIYGIQAATTLTAEVVAVGRP